MSEAIRTADVQQAPPGDAGANVYARRHFIKVAAACILGAEAGCFRPDTLQKQEPVVLVRTANQNNVEVQPEPAQPKDFAEIPAGTNIRDTLLAIEGIPIGLFVENNQVTVRCGEHSFRVKSIVRSKNERTGKETHLELSEQMVQSAGGMIGLNRTEKGVSGSVFWIGGEVSEADLKNVATELAAHRMFENEGDIRLELPLADNKIQSLILVRNTESND